MDNKNISTAVIGALLGLLPLLASAFISWLGKRSRVARKEEAIDFAQRQVTFISAWLQARQQSDSTQKMTAVKKKVSEELDEIKSNVDEMMDIPHSKPLVLTDNRNFLQRLFLFYPAHAADGWAYRGLFFMIVGVMLLFIVSATAANDHDTWVGTVILLIPLFLLAILFHALAIHSDRSAEKYLPSPKANQP
jgi:Flp pilus assembly protein TadB